MSACNIYDAAGNLAWSLGDYGSVMCDVMVVPSNTEKTVPYPAFSGRTLWVEETSSDGASRGNGDKTTVTIQSGVPVVTLFKNTKNRTCYVWAE